MLNTHSIATVDAARYGDHFVRPLYDSYCWSGLPGTIRQLLTGTSKGVLPDDTFSGLSEGDFDKVILIFLDGFGWDLFERHYERYAFLKRFVEEGRASKITSMFPSTTAAHTSYLFTRRYPIQTGIHEWQYYEPLADDLILPLPFSYVGAERETLRTRGGLDGRGMFPRQTLFLSLQHHKENPVKSHVYQSYEYAQSTYSQAMTRGAVVHGYRTSSEALIHLADSVVLSKSPRLFYYLYLDTLDAIEHRNGPGSRQTAAELDTLMMQLERLLHKSLIGRAKKTLLLLVADHGQIGVDMSQTIYLDTIADTITPWLRTNQAGKPLIPAGSPRDLFLYIKDEALNEAHAYLSTWLDGRAQVSKTSTLIADGLFGPKVPSQRFLERAGNLIILPYDSHTLWWHGTDKKRPLKGLHGGLSAAEMHTPFLALPYL